MGTLSIGMGNVAAVGMYGVGTNDQNRVQAAIDRVANPTKVKSESITIGPLTQYDSFDVNNWSAISGETLSIDNADKVEGTGSLKVVGGPEPGIERNVALDLSSYNIFEVWVKADATDWFRISFYDSTNKVAYFDKRIITAATWQELEIDVSDPTYFGNVDWSDIAKIQIHVLSAAGGYTFRVDDLRWNTYNDFKFSGQVEDTVVIDGKIEDTDFVVNSRDGKIKGIVGQITAGAETANYSYYRGGIVYLREGTFNFDGVNDDGVGVSVPSNVRLIGSGKSTRIFWRYNSSGKVAIRINRAINASIENLYVDCGMNDSDENAGVAMYASRNCDIKKCYIEKCYNAFIASISCIDCRITDNYCWNDTVSGGATHGIDLDIDTDRIEGPNRRIYIQGNTVKNPGHDSTRMENSSNIYYLNNIFYDEIAIDTNDANNFKMENILFSGNDFYEIVTIGKVDGDGGVTIAENSFNSSAYLLISTSDYLDNPVMVTNNIFTNTYTRGIYITGNIKNVFVSGNILRNTQVESIYVINATGNIHIDGNQIMDSQNDGISINNASGKVKVTNNFLSNAGDYGMYIEDSDHVEVEGNTVDVSLRDCFFIEDCDNIILRGNTTVESGEQGILVRNSDRPIVEDNNCKANGKHGIWIAESSDDAIVRDNNSSGNGTETVDTYSNIVFTTDDNIVFGNFVAADAVSAYGIRFAGAAAGGIAKYNRVAGGGLTADTFDNGGANTISDNI